MSVISVFFSGQFLTALILYAIAIIAAELLVKKLHAAVSDVGITEWMVEQVALPLARACALAIFIVSAYPILFGLTAAPPLGSILFSEEGRLVSMVNLAFILSLLLPLLPVIGSRRSLILPFQGVAIASLLFHWLASFKNVPHSYWPGISNILLVILIVLLVSPLAHFASQRFGTFVNRLTERAGFEQLAFEGLLLFLQAPALLVYTLSLGKQIA